MSEDPAPYSFLSGDPHALEWMVGPNWGETLQAVAYQFPVTVEDLQAWIDAGVVNMRVIYTLATLTGEGYSGESITAGVKAMVEARMNETRAAIQNNPGLRAWLMETGGLDADVLPTGGADADR